MNTKLKTFEQQLYTLLNTSGLSIGEIYYIMKCALYEIEQVYNTTVAREQEDTESFKPEEKE